ncbi:MULTISPECIES: ABC transporter permease [unclassified Micromonospora]|uniref:ABC transporter permease n=1 Tax=unclassified Micromonospora TaxID=2617518 RepID=UPI0036383DDF
MLRLLFNRLLQTAFVLLIVSVIVFLLLHLAPGDPVDLLFGEQNVSAEQKEEVRRNLGLDRPLLLQYLHFLGSAVTGDLGNSIFRGASVLSLIKPALFATIELTVGAVLVATIVGVPIAVVSALRQNSFVDRAGSAIALFGISMPSFWLGIMLILLFSVKLGVLPTGSQLDLGVDVPHLTGFVVLDSLLSGDPAAFGSALRHVALPSVTLGTALAATVVRVLRAGLIEAKNQDFIDAVRARGVSHLTVIRHMLRNALPPTVIMMGVKIGSLLGGAIVVETIFSWPGLGRLIVEAIRARDYPLVQGGVLLMAVLFVLVNLCADILHGVLDPRIRQGRRSRA